VKGKLLGVADILDQSKVDKYSYLSFLRFERELILMSLKLALLRIKGST